MKHTVHEISLKNGVKGLFVHCPDATVMTFDINFRAGDYLTPPDKWEAAHLMQHLLLGANELIPKARAFQAEFEVIEKGLHRIRTEIRFHAAPGGLPG
jgi:predicted Zn-dependent peptidase